MKRILWICGLLIVTLSACKKDSSDDYAAQQAVVDDETIQAYMKANSIIATKDPSGLYYSVVTPGTGPYPTSTSTVNVNYKGQFTDGTQFDSRNYTADLSLPASDGGVIEGWRIGIPKINKGGRLLLMIPSALAYGQKGQNTIPANKVLIFTIDMISFK
jgi:FKBP-type peptidyl-prolyl cis-trans isomerase FkpA